jgi:hypothetical protein
MSTYEALLSSATAKQQVTLALPLVPKALATSDPESHANREPGSVRRVHGRSPSTEPGDADTKRVQRSGASQR